MERDYLQEHVGGTGLNKESRFRLDIRKKILCYEGSAAVEELAQRYCECPWKCASPSWMGL